MMVGTIKCEVITIIYNIGTIKCDILSIRSTHKNCGYLNFELIFSLKLSNS